MRMTIKEVKEKFLLKEFIYLPEKIHATHSNWVPPLYIDDEKFFSASRNPAFKKNETILLIAYDGDKPVGRIMGIIPKEFNELKKVKTARFCYFECYNDKNIFDALLTAIEQWAISFGCNEMIGPMGFSDKEPQGFLTFGFNEPTMLVTNCSFSFMADYILQNGYEPYVELCQYDVAITKKIISRYQQFNDRAVERLQLNIHDFVSTGKIRPFVKPVFELINKSYTDIYGFTNVSAEEADEFANRFLPLLNPKLIKIITNKTGKVIAFVIGMADISEGIKKGRGRLLPFGWWYILRASKTSNRLVLLLGSVDPNMQHKGLDAVLANKLITSAMEQGFTKMDSHLIMKTNTKMRQEIERLGNSRLYKEYTIFKKNL